MELEAEHTLAEIEAIKMGSGGALHIGAGPVWLRVFLPSAIAALQREHPALQIDLVTGVVETHLSALMNGKVDLLCGDLDFPNHPELTSVHLLDLEFVVIASKNHPLAEQTSVPAEELLNYPWVTLRGDYLGRNRFGSFFAAHNLSPPASNILISPGVEMFGFLTADKYLAYIPKQTLPLANRYDCKRIDIETGFWSAPHGVVYRTTKTPEPAVSALVSILKNQFEAPTIRKVAS